MLNLNNLMPIEEVNSRRTREQHSKDSSKAGKASVKKRRQMKTFKELCNTFLDNQVTQEEMVQKMVECGIADGDTSYKMAMVVAMANEAVKGNVKAFEVLRDTIGEKPKEKVDFEINQQASKVLSSINKQLNKSGKNE